MLDSGRCELSKATVGGADGGATAITLEAGSRRSFTLPHMRNLGQLRQLLLEVDASSQQVRMLWKHSTACTGRAIGCF